MNNQEMGGSMNTMTRDGRTIEEVTVASLDESLPGLEALCADSVKCGALLMSDMGRGMQRFQELAQNIKNFYVFENDVRSMFSIDSTSICDQHGDLKNAEVALSGLMKDIIDRLDAQDVHGLSDLLQKSVPPVIERFVNLLPVLRLHIQNEYIPAI